MVVTIDIGNTNITFGLFISGRENPDGPSGPLYYGNIRTIKEMTADELAIGFINLLKIWGVEENDFNNNVIISSVVPELDYVFTHMFDKYFSAVPHFIGIKDIPLIVHYDFPDEIGADRLVNAYAGCRLFPGENLIIVDFGTATTFDVIDQGRYYEGGLIMTGILTSLRALEEKASKLPHIDIEQPSRLIAKNTADGIRSGVINGAGAMVDELAGRIVHDMNWKHYKVVATGGLSKLIKPASKAVEMIDRRLTLKGLYYLWQLKSFL